jgi:hypothetical protein
MNRAIGIIALLMISAIAEGRHRQQAFERLAAWRGQTTQPQVELPRSQSPDLGRPTKKDDPLPVLNLEEYLVGKWTFEWDVPESALGPGGRITGTEIFRRGRDGRHFSSDWEAQGPSGAFRGQAIMVYHQEQRVVIRHETDSRGFSVLSSGTIGGDLGGIYTIHYQSAPFTFGGKVLRMKAMTQLVSPVHYKVRSQISEADGPFTNFGSPWWRKEAGSSGNRDRGAAQ